MHPGIEWSRKEHAGQEGLRKGRREREREDEDEDEDEGDWFEAVFGPSDFVQLARVL